MLSWHVGISMLNNARAGDFYLLIATQLLEHAKHVGISECPIA
jgi:hypothetical protein